MTLQEIYKRINEYNPQDLTDMTAEEYKDAFLKNAREEGFVEGVREKMHSYFSDDEKNRIQVSDTKGVLEAFSKLSADRPQFAKEIEDFADHFVAPIDIENPVTHPNSAKIEELKAQTQNEQMKSDLDYINQNVLIGHNTKFLNVFMKLGEGYPSHSAQEQIQSSIPVMQKDELFQNNFEVNDGEISYTNYDNKEFYSKLSQTDLTYSEESKKKIVDILTTLDNMKDMDGTPLFKIEKYVRDEGQKKEYAFKNLADCFRAASEALKAGDTEKLSQIAAFHKESVKQYDTLLEKVKDLNMPYMPGNLSFARNGSMPDKYVKDIKGVSQVNGFWGILATIKKSGATIEEFVNGPRKIYEKTIEGLKDFKPFNEMGHQVGDLGFLKAMATGDYGQLRNLAMSASYGQRYFFASSMLDASTSAKNRGLANLYLGTKASSLSQKYNRFGKSFLGEDKIQTYKNVLINTDPQKDYTKLSANPDMPRCPLSGDKAEAFDYQNYLQNGDIDFAKLAQNLEQNKAQLASDPDFGEQRADFEKAISEISLDLVKTNRLDNSPEFDRFAALSGKSISQIYQAKSGKEAFSQYMMNQYRSINGEKLNHGRINETLNVLKGLNEKYSSRNFLSKYLTPGGWAERKALKEMKIDMAKNGVEEQQLESFLSGKTGKEEFARNLPKEEPSPEVQNENGAHINMDEFDQKSENISFLADLNRELGEEIGPNEKEIPNKKNGPSPDLNTNTEKQL